MTPPTLYVRDHQVVVGDCATDWVYRAATPAEVAAAATAGRVPSAWTFRYRENGQKDFTQTADYIAAHEGHLAELTPLYAFPELEQDTK